MIIKTKRLTLRPAAREDAPRFAALCNDIDIARNTARIPHPYAEKDAEAFMTWAEHAATEGKEHIFAVTRAGAIIACAGVMRIEHGVYEIGYWVGADDRGDGVATEAARAVIQFAFERCAASRLTSGHFIDNPASGRVLEKVGFRYTGETVMTMSAGRGGEAETARMTLEREDFTPWADVVCG